jgi:hypothetical protein
VTGEEEDRIAYHNGDRRRLLLLTVAMEERRDRETKKAS